MDWAHIHLLLNHVPVIGTVGAVLLLAFALWRRSAELTRVVLGLFVLLAIIAVVVYWTGEPAEHLVEGLPGISEPILEEHEEFSLIATIVLGIVGALALAGLVAFRRAAAVPRAFTFAVLLSSLVAAGAMGYTANLGGQIRHSEIRPGATAPAEAAVEHDSD